MPGTGLRVGVAFGGRSVEHDVSIITGLQAVEVLSERHRPLSIYISRSGSWYAGDELRDIAAYRSEQAPQAPEVSFDLHRGRLMPLAGGGSLLRGRSHAVRRRTGFVRRAVAVSRAGGLAGTCDARAGRSWRR